MKNVFEWPEWFLVLCFAIEFTVFGLHGILALLALANNRIALGLFAFVMALFSAFLAYFFCVALGHKSDGK